MMERIRAYLELVRFEHTVFALPFGISSLILLTKHLPSLRDTFLIILALVFARTAGMAINRIVDEPYDRLNPRTSSWPLVSGRVTKKEAYLIAVISSLLFIATAYMLNKLAFLLSPVVIGLLILYPYAKRFTHLPHFILGAVYFLIPIAIDVALNSRISLLSVIMGTGMAFWVAGFDILYALQDYDFDKRIGLKSLPVKIGVKGSLLVSGLCHSITFISLLLVGIVDNRLGTFYLLSMFILLFLFIYQRKRLKDEAFFTFNGYISIIYLCIVFTDVFILKG